MCLHNENSCLYKWKGFHPLFPKEVKVNWAHLNQGYDFLEAYLLTESFSFLLATIVWGFSASITLPCLSVKNDLISNYMHFLKIV